MRTLSHLLLIAGTASIASADVKLPAVISDHMVLQRDADAHVWGWANANEAVTVTLGKQTMNAMPNADGRWQVSFPKLAAGGPHTLIIKGSNTITINDVLVGEVWLGSGQSNMAMTVNRCLDFEAESAKCDLPMIRMFTEKSGGSSAPNKVGSGAWVVCSPKTVGGFSGTLFFMGRELHAKLNVPVGLINSSVGGTPIELWVDPAVQHSSTILRPLLEQRAKSDAAFDVNAAKAKHAKDLEAWKQAAAKAKADGKPAPQRPADPVARFERNRQLGGLFLGKIEPLIPYTVRGFTWYQGEANSGKTSAPYYGEQLQLLVKDWRKRWGMGDLPFAWVQLPNYDNGNDWPTMREQMRQSLKLPNTGMAITIDIGEAKDIHPRNKQDVGRRLAAWALATVYGQKVVASGPLPTGHEVAGNTIVVKLQYAEGLKSTGEPKNFELYSEGKWHKAKAKIADQSVIVTAEGVSKPSGVRYAWSNNPSVNVTNAAGYPLSPFTLGDGK